MSRLSTINWLLAAGVCASLLNLGDLILRPKQKAAFQRALETCVLWLHYERPLRWLAGLRRVRPIHIATCAVMVIILLAISLNIQDDSLPRISYYPFYFAHFRILLLFVSALLLSLLPLSRLLPEVMDFVLGDGRLRTIVINFGMAVFMSIQETIIGILIAVPIILVLTVCLIAMGVGANSAAAVSGLAANGVAVAVALVLLSREWGRRVVLGSMAFNAALLALLLAGVLLCAEGAISLARAVGWRVVEYSKGAWAAVILLATVALAVCRAIMTG